VYSRGPTVEHIAAVALEYCGYVDLENSTSINLLKILLSGAEDIREEMPEYVAPWGTDRFRLMNGERREKAQPQAIYGVISDTYVNPSFRTLLAYAEADDPTLFRCLPATFRKMAMHLRLRSRRQVWKRGSYMT
jgi:hypothetical protein